MDRRIIIAAIAAILAISILFLLINPLSCGNGKCEKSLGEKCDACAADCGHCESLPLKPTPICGDLYCGKDENTTCPQDCVAKPPVEPTSCTDECGDGGCDYVMCKKLPCPCLETPETCPQDCNGGISPPLTLLPTGDYADSPFGISTGLLGNEAILGDLGIRWTREGVAWGPPHAGDIAVETVKGRFDYSFNDEQAVNLYRHNTKPVVNVGDMNPWDQNACHQGCAASAPSDGSKYPCFYIYCNETDYQNFLRKTIERYDGDGDYGCALPAPDCYAAGDRQYPSAEVREAIAGNPWKYWEILNEPFSELWWKAWVPGNAVSEYIQILEASNEAIKQACPDCKVAIGGLFDYTGVGSPRNGMTLEQIKAGLDAAGNPFDVMNFHPYGNGSNIGIALDYFTQNYPDKELIITEMSLLKGDEKLPTQKEESIDVIRRYVLSIKAGVRIIMWFILQESGSEPAFDPGCLLAADGTKKLQYYTYKLMTEKLEGSDWNSVQEVYNTGNVHAYKFVKKETGKPVWVVWWDYWNEPKQTTKTVTLQVGSLTSVKITEAVPHFDKGLSLQNSGETYPSFFDIETKAVTNGQVTLQLGQSPVYIERA